MPNYPRRRFIKQFGLYLSAQWMGFFKIKNLQASDNPVLTNNSDYLNTITRLFGAQTICETGQIKITAPAIAEDGAVVPVSVSSEMNHISKIYLLVEKNPAPLTAEFSFIEDAAVYFSTHIKMAESSQIIVIAQTDNQLFKSAAWVQVVQGGCGSG